jgi:hypothetical protein
MSKMYRCDECNTLQEREDLARAIFVLCPDPYYEETEAVCFRCGCSVYEVAECDRCGDYESIEYMRDGLCQICYKKEEEN